MIYNNSFLRKELKESYFEHSISVRNRIRYALFLALTSFGVHFIFLTLTRSILSEVAPQLIDPSYFSVLSIYLRVSYFFYVLYLAANYNFLTFSELKNNKWYILIKFGFSPVKMTFAKLYARLYTIFFVYTSGFFATMFLTSILKYPFNIEYAVSFFILGLIDMIIIVIITLTSSLYFTKGEISDYFMLFSVFCLTILKYILGYYDVINDKSKFGSIFVLAYFSRYIATLALILLLCIIIIFIQAKTKAKYYNFSFYIRDLDFPDSVKISLGSDKKPKVSKEYNIRTKRTEKVVSRLLNSIMIFIISLFIFFNIIVLLISLTAQIQGTTFFKIIPYVFHSETMQPAINYNDLAIFKKIGLQENVNVGEIILYQSPSEVNVARIISLNNNKIVVDIDNYSSINTTRLYREAISRTQIFGKFIGRSRWLGVLILFANTTLGRFLLLLIPSVLLFYYNPITEFIRYISFQNLKEK